MATLASQTTAISRPFEQIQTAAERAECLAGSIYQFLGRATYAENEVSSGAAGSPAPLPTYVNQIDRLHHALNSIGDAVEALHRLG